MTRHAHPTEQRIVTRSPAETRDAARALLLELPPGPVVLALHGELGSGKTCFVQGLAAALGVRQAATSPTFTIVNEYRGGARLLFHIDLYRLRGPSDVWGLGIDEYLESDGITAIEWAERAGNLLPDDTIHIRFEVAAGRDERAIAIQRPTPRRC